MKKIIVPIDFSADSINALEHAINIANKVDAELRIMHVTKSKNFELPFTIEGFDQMIGKSLKDFMEVIQNKYKDKVNNKLDYKIREGKVYKEIVNQAKYDDAYMIVMGTHGASGFEEMWIGSNAYKVVSHADCPVLTIRHGFIKTKCENIVVPIDISPDTRKKVPFTIEFASYMGSKIHILLVSENDFADVNAKLEAYGKQVEEFINKHNVPFVKERIIGDNITTSTIEYAKKVGADMISIMTEQPSNIFNLWLGDYAQQMVNNAPMPVLSYGQ